MKKLVYIILITGIISGFPSCKNADSIYEGYLVPNGLTYPAKAMNPVAYPGKERIQISWQNGTDPSVEKARISWNNDTEGVDVDIQSGADTISRTIESLPENTYSFMIRTYDAKGNVSVPVEVIGTVYGAVYERTLANRPLQGTRYIDESEGLRIEWYKAFDNEVGLELAYTDLNGNNRTRTVDVSETVTIVPDFNSNEPLSYRTMYKPDTMAIDVFYTERREIAVTIVTVPAKKGSWLFDDPTDLTKAETGANLTAVGTGLVPVAGPSASNGAVRLSPYSHYVATHGIPPTAGVGRVGEYTLMVDVKIPHTGAWYSILQTDPNNSNDFDFGIHPDGGVTAFGTGIYSTPITPNVWHRIMFIFKFNSKILLYIDGVLRGETTEGVNNNDLLLAGTALLFADDNGEDSELEVAEVAIWDVALEDWMVKKVGTIK